MLRKMTQPHINTKKYSKPHKICRVRVHPLMNVKGPFTSSIHLSTCTFPLLNAKVPFTSSTPVHLHISHCWKSRGRSQARYICPPVHFLCWTSRCHSQAPHLSTFTFPTVESQGAVHKLDTSVHLHISQRWLVKGQFLQRISIGPLLASFFCPLRTLIHHISFNFSLWPAH